MEPSIVLSVTAAISMSDWERDAASNNNNNPPHHHGSTGSSDDDDEEGEFDYQHHHQNAPLASRWMHNTLTTTMTGMVAPPLFESPHLQYALPRNTPSYQTRETSRSETYPSSIYEYDPEAYASRLAFDAPTESAAIGVAAPASPFVTRAQYPSSYDDFGVIFPNELSSKQGHALEVDEDDRKPKATEVTIKNSPHRKSHSLSDDPFARYPAVDSADQERPDPYINPSLSFTDDDEMARQSETHFDMGHFGAVVDPRFQVAGYPAPCPNYAPPLAFKIGDSSPPSILLDRSSSSSASQESPLSPSILVKLRKNPEAFYRSPTHEELKAAGSDRAKSAVKTWYARFNELVAYKARYGHCNVPQKYAENPQLGIVRS